MSKVICIVGPTASGKTGLAIELAKKIDAEVISADSMQIYKDLDVGTAKVTEEEAQGIPHHMINVCNVEDKFSVADFKSMCYDKIEEIQKRGKNVIIAGGTGLYVNAVVYNMNFTEEETDTALRQELEQIAKEKGNEYLHNMLKELDPKSAEEIHMNNVKRVIRAIEMAKTVGLKSEHMEAEKTRIANENAPYEFVVFCIEQEREYLYNRINLRVDLMIKDGILDEAKKVYDMKLPSNNTCMQAIGYKEFFPYFEGTATLEECIETLKKETRHYAKRQMTWFNNKLDCIMLDGSKPKDELVNEIISKL
jgi:tRNA dimethylallyltransferase